MTQILPMYKLRVVGGTLYITGFIIMMYNLYKTAKAGSLIAEEAAEAPALAPYIAHENEHWHRVLERKPIQFLALSFIAVLIGGIVELIPTFMISSNVPTIASVKPYTPLELQGRDIYIREGCNACHTQMVRPFRHETERYGEYSKAGEFVYDHPFLWGSKRTGPDLHRVGAKYPDSWHLLHMYDPTLMSAGSIMPMYPWLLENKLDITTTASKINAMRSLGVPYADGFADKANAVLKEQADKITDALKADKKVSELFQVETLRDKEIIALIAYLQRLGVDIKTKPNLPQ